MSTADQRSDVQATLMAAIGCGELPGGSLLSATSLTSRYGATLPEVREALALLAVDHLVEPAAGHRFRAFAPSLVDLEECMELRRTLEVPAARQAVEHGISDADIMRLETLAAATADHADDVVAYIKADLEFHLFLVDLCGDPNLTELVRLLRTRCRIDKLAYPVERFMLQNAEEHQEMVGLARAGDASGLGELLSVHISRPVAHHRETDPSRP